jgi:SAM-dependent methyltransferase
MGTDARKQLGQYYTPPHVVASLARWLLRSPADTFLDPACGDGRFLGMHERSTGVDLCATACEAARQRAPEALVLQTDFFTWAASATDRYTAVGGNPPFIRYQNFAGPVRRTALALSRGLGAEFSQLTSSWAPFVAVAATLLRPGGRLGFVVPAEIGHASYAPTLLTALCRRFERVLVLAVRRKMFPHLAEDTWLLYAEGFGGSADGVDLAAVEDLGFCPTPPVASRRVPISQMALDGARLRKHLLPPAARELYDRLSGELWTRRVAELADISIGYVTGANSFFHLTPGQARLWDVPESLTRVAVRRSEQLPPCAVEPDTVRGWLQADLPVLLLTLPPEGPLPGSVRRYLDSAEAREARGRYKCRVRTPWYSVPGVVTPDGFLSVMCGRATSLVANRASCVCTNSVHTVRMRGRASLSRLQDAWLTPLSRLSQEIEGHPLGGGMLKLEPREAGRVVVPWTDHALEQPHLDLLQEGIDCARSWRHVA